MLLCRLKKCQFEGTDLDELRQHWGKEHPDLKFPEMIGDDLRHEVIAPNVLNKNSVRLY